MTLNCVYMLKLEHSKKIKLKIKIKSCLLSYMYVLDITHGINFSYTTEMASLYIIISHGFQGDIHVPEH